MAHFSRDYAAHLEPLVLEEPSWQASGETGLFPTLSNTLSTEEAYSKEFDSRYDDFPKRSQVDRTISREDTQVVLSLDGGGVRGLSTLLILQRLMEKIARIETTRWPKAETSADSPQIERDLVQDHLKKLQEKLDRGRRSGDGTAFSDRSPTSNFLPCHYFDYIAGTSTAGLIAAMLGRLWMSIDCTLHEFNDLTGSIYGLRYRPKKSKMKLMLRLGRSPDEKVKELMQEHFGNDSLRSDRDRCKTIICSFEKTPGKSLVSPFLFRSYAKDQPERSADSHSSPCKVSDVLRATGCSPYYFSPVRLGSQEFLDAGVRWTNPTGQVFQEVLQNGSMAPTLMLSIGCGYVPADSHQPIKALNIPSRSRMAQNTTRLNQALESLSDEVHVFMEQKQRELDVNYYRVNAPLDLSKVKAEHGYSWRMELRALRNEIEKVTKEYLEKNEDVDATLEQCASALVDLRRQRSLTPGWEAFALGIRYRCKASDDCPLKEKILGRAELAAHLRDYHHIKLTNLDDHERIKMLVQRGRVRSDEM